MMRKTNESRHDFRPWAQTLDWVVQNLCGQAPLLDGHREQQDRIANPAWQWLRELALAVIRDGKQCQLMETHNLADVAYRNNVELPGLGQGMAYDSASESERKQVLLQIGRKLNTAFDSADEIEIDGITVKRSSEQHNDMCGKLRDYRKYAFFPKQSVDVP
ncbi:MAG: hypothetical protein NT118_16150 [Lentisphaerae bacterium]|nr:hypothetical protein [Lentisphaerota bacterium]